MSIDNDLGNRRDNDHNRHIYEGQDDDGGVRPMDTSDDVADPDPGDVLHNLLMHQCDEQNDMPRLDLRFPTPTTISSSSSGNGSNVATPEEIRGRSFIFAKRNNQKPQQQPPNDAGSIFNPMNLMINPLNV